MSDALLKLFQGMVAYGPPTEPARLRVIDVDLEQLRKTKCSNA
jgi:hypothetical protein